MASGAILKESITQAHEGLGGRGLTSLIINNEVPATCDPLGPDNMLIFAPGYLSGTHLVNTSRLSIGAKSPLTGGIKESNVGGTVAVDLAHLGITAIIVTGKPVPGGCRILKINMDGDAELIDGMPYKGMRTYDLVEKLKKEYGENNSITCIGPAGEFQLSAASIQTTDLDGRPCRAAGRGGLGAVMGSKGLKAIIVAQGGKSADPLADAELFTAPAKSFAKTVNESSEGFAQLGTARMVAPVNALGAFPTCNARYGQFEEFERISGETMAEIIKERGGKTTHKGCARCIINCSNEYVDKGGKYVTSSLEYETIWSMGGMIGNADLDIIAKLDFLCDDIGLDTISIGVAIAVAMDAGYKPFGDGHAAIEMLEQVAKGTEFGKIIGNGPVSVGKHFNHERVAVVKGQSLSAYDPRTLQGMAVTYATSPMGGDHTAGWVVGEYMPEHGGSLDPLSPKGQVAASRKAQLDTAVVDAVGICEFAKSGLYAPGGLTNVCSMIAAKMGKPFSEADWHALGKCILKAEISFNRKAGFTAEDDRLPKMYYEEPLPPLNRVVEISNEEMDQTFDF